MRILLTRPREDSERLAQRLQQSGHQCVNEPLLTITPMVTPTPDLKNVQAVMLTSANALAFLKASDHSDLLKLSCYCVGTSTAEAARAFGFSKAVDVSGDGLALARYIAAKLQPSDGRILHITGRDSDKRSYDILQNAGFAVQSWITYAAETATSLTPATLDLWQRGDIDGVLLFSTRTAATLKTLVLQHELQSCCKKMFAIGMSGMVIAALSDLPWRQTKAALEPTEDSLLEQVTTILPEAP